MDEIQTLKMKDGDEMKMDEGYVEYYDETTRRRRRYEDEGVMDGS